MPSVRKPNPIAIAVSDLHLSLIAPACRAETDWLSVQEHYLDQITDASFKLAAKTDVLMGKYLPVLIAGDLFNRWNPPPELLSFAFKHLPPNVYAVPGQHDLPQHNYEDMHRSGYGVLVEAERIRNVENLIPPAPGHNFALWGFPWGKELHRERLPDCLNIALIHQYCWMEGCSFPGAPEEGHVAKLKNRLNGFDVAVFGDNHKGFLASYNLTKVLNCGGFIRAKSDEIKYKPSYGIIFEDGSVKRVFLDTSIDRFHENAEERPEQPLDMQAFIRKLENLGEHGFNFRDVVLQHLKKEDIDPQTRQILLEALE